MKRYDQCDDTCTTDCGHCKGAGRPAPELSPSERIVARYFENGEAAPESYVRQHVSEETCWCEPVQVGTLGVWTHNMGDEQ